MLVYVCVLVIPTETVAEEALPAAVRDDLCHRRLGVLDEELGLGSKLALHVGPALVHLA